MHCLAAAGTTRTQIWDNPFDHIVRRRANSARSTTDRGGREGISGGTIPPSRVPSENTYYARAASTERCRPRTARSITNEDEVHERRPAPQRLYDGNRPRGLRCGYYHTYTDDCACTLCCGIRARVHGFGIGVVRPEGTASTTKSGGLMGAPSPMNAGRKYELSNWTQPRIYPTSPNPQRAAATTRPSTAPTQSKLARALHNKVNAFNCQMVEKQRARAAAVAKSMMHTEEKRHQVQEQTVREEEEILA